MDRRFGVFGMAVPYRSRVGQLIVTTPEGTTGLLDTSTVILLERLTDLDLRRIAHPDPRS